MLAGRIVIGQPRRGPVPGAVSRRHELHVHVEQLAVAPILNQQEHFAVPVSPQLQFGPQGVQTAVDVTDLIALDRHDAVAWFQAGPRCGAVGNHPRNDHACGRVVDVDSQPPLRRPREAGENSCLARLYGSFLHAARPAVLGPFTGVPAPVVRLPGLRSGIRTFTAPVSLLARMSDTTAVFAPSADASPSSSGNPVPSTGTSTGSNPSRDSDRAASRTAACSAAGQTVTCDVGDLAPGAYAVTEALPPGWTLTDLSCADPDGGSAVDPAAATATLDLDPGEHVVCTFVNTARGSVTIATETGPADPGG